MSTLPLLGVISILFGILVIITPEILNYLIAIFFILVGVSAISFWYQIKNKFK